MCNKLESTVTIAEVDPTEYKMTYVIGGKRRDMCIHADDYAHAARIAASIAGCDESDIMFPVCDEDIARLVEAEAEAAMQGIEQFRQKIVDTIVECAANELRASSKISEGD